MNFRNFILATLAICVACNFCTAQAQAQTRVGEAAVVKNEVLRVSGSGGTPINIGDAVLRNETVRTGVDSAARLVMRFDQSLARRQFRHHSGQDRLQ